MVVGHPMSYGFVCIQGTHVTGVASDRCHSRIESNPQSKTQSVGQSDQSRIVFSRGEFPADQGECPDISRPESLDCVGSSCLCGSAVHHLHASALLSELWSLLVDGVAPFATLGGVSNVMPVSGNTTLLLLQPLSCNPATGTALHPLSWCFES